MGLLVKGPQMDMFARPILVNGVPSRGIWHRDANEFMAEDGSIVIDNKVSVDVLNSEFAIVPRQGDAITIPADGTVPAEGTFTILSSHDDAGGMTNLVLQQFFTTTASDPLPPSPGAPRVFTPLRSKRDL